MKILYAVSEVAPFSKTGGLADVAQALPATLARLGHQVRVLSPKYGGVNEHQWSLQDAGQVAVALGGQTYAFRLWSGRISRSTAEFIFLDNPALFGRSGIYQENGEDYPDNLIRFGAFSRAVLETCEALDWRPDVIHCNDWQTALVLAYLRLSNRGLFAKGGIGTVFTIHNLGFQGIFPGEAFSLLSLPTAYFTPQTLEFYGKINVLKAGLLFSHVINTVSPTYSREILTSEFGCGMEGILHVRRSDLFGILNGADYEDWDPAHDPYLPVQYDRENLTNKLICKISLQKLCKLPQSPAPLIGMVSRLTTQKGLALVLDVVEELMSLDLQLVILGTGERAIEEALRKETMNYPEKLSVHIGFDVPLSHRILAGSDLFLMPSLWEPCGLNQLYGLRYGTIPIVRKTGGLADTIIDATPRNLKERKATGFMFESPNGHSLLTIIRLALEIYRDQSVWKSMIRNAMSADFSWDRSAHEYLALYERAVQKAGADR